MEDRIGKLKNTCGRAAEVIAAEIKLGGIYQLEQRLNALRIDIFPVLEYALLRIGETEHVGDPQELLDDAPLVIIRILKLIDNHEGELVSVKRPERAALFKNRCDRRGEKIEAEQAFLRRKPVAFGIPFAVKGRFAQPLVRRIEETNGPAAE